MNLCIIQARMSSSRFPGKVLKTVLGKPLIEYLLERVRRSKEIDKIIVAIPEDPEDNVLNDYLQNYGCMVFRGSREDVLDRYYQASRQHIPELIVRITGDCPLIDPEITDATIRHYKSRNLDYVSNTLRRPVYPKGLDTEVFSFEALKTAWKEAVLPSEREHVTPFIYKHPERFKISCFQPVEDCSGERWTVDYGVDFTLIKNILEHFYPQKPSFGMNDILEFKKQNLTLFKINQHISRDDGYLRSLQKDQSYLRAKK